MVYDNFFRIKKGMMDCYLNIKFVNLWKYYMNYFIEEYIKDYNFYNKGVYFSLWYM